MMLTIFALAVRSRFDRTNPAAFYFAVWILATGFLVAWVRGAAGFTIASRYSMYSNLLLIFCYSYLAHYLPRRWPGFNRRLFYTTAVVFAVGLCLMADVSAYRKLGSRRRMVLSGIEFYRTQPEVNSPMIDPMVELPKRKGYGTGCIEQRRPETSLHFAPEAGDSLAQGLTLLAHFRLAKTVNPAALMDIISHVIQGCRPGKWRSSRL
jgi:hypothetical protein